MVVLEAAKRLEWREITTAQPLSKENLAKSEI
jgi:hypothetical protein